MSSAASATAAKHFASLTSLLLAIFVVSASGMLFRLDFDDYRAEVRALNTLTDFAATDWSLADDSVEKPVYAALRSWIGGHQSALLPKLDASRTALLAALRRAGLDVEDRVLEGKVAATGEIPFRLLRLVPPGELDDAAHHRPAEIADVIDRLLWATARTRVVLYEVAPGVDVEAASGRQLAGYRLLSVRPGPDGLAVEVEERLSPMVQRPQMNTTFAVPATPTAFTDAGPSIVELYVRDRDRAAFEALAAEAAALQQIRQRYGLLPAGEARGIASSSLVEGFKSVSVLGFRISPRRLPLLIFGLDLMVLSLLLGAVEIGRARGARLPQGESGNPVEICVHSRPFRWAMWAGLPAASVALASAGGSLGVLAVLAGAAVLAALGALTAARASPVFARQ